VFWAGMFGLFLGGFAFVEQFKLTVEIYEYLFGLFFLTLFVMLGVSTGIIIYAGLLHGRESAWLLTQPVSEDDLFAHKFAESIAFAGWGVLLLGSPVLVAYGLIVKAGAIYFLSIVPLLAAFVGLPGALGATAALLVGYVMPRRPRTILAVLSVVILVVIGRLVRSLFLTPGTALTPDWMDNFLGRLSFSRHPLLPSRWTARAVIDMASGSTVTGLAYICTIAANAAMAWLVATWVARKILRATYCRAQGERSGRRRRATILIDRIVSAVFPFLSQQVRLLIAKDARCFMRDPAQWSQFFIFFGLLAAYFANIRHFSSNLDSPVWRNLVSFLNLSVTALLLATFTSRFIFPMMSLEGRNAWMLNLLPLRRSQILWGKFAFSAVLALVACESLLLISDLQLGLDPGLICVHVALMAILCLGLSAISVGLGARLPNYRESDPSKIAAGFGGTLNLVISLLFLLIAIGAVALPCHLYFAGIDSRAEGFRRLATNWSQTQFQVRLAIGLSLSILTGIAAVVIPLRLGLRALEDQEF
jgi:ABC-2 type transport system permease protein